MNGTIRAVVIKEVLDAVRDPRALMSALLYPLVGPLLVGILIVVLASEDAHELPVVGREHAENLVTFIQQQNVTVLPPPADPEESVRRGEHDVVLEIPADFEESFRRGEPARVRLIYDDSRTESLRPVMKTRRVLYAFDQSVGSLRLLARGVSPELAHPITVEEVDLSTPQKMAARILNMLPMFLILAAFFAGMQVAIDATAGERERSSLEALLVNPVTRLALVLGKWATTALFSMVGVLVTLAGSLVMLAVIPLEELGLVLHLSASDVGGMLAVILPLSLLSAAAQILVALFARSFKEAQTYLSALLFVPMLPGMMLALSPMETELWMLLIPTLAHVQLLSGLIQGEGMSGSGYAIATGMTVLLSTLALAQTARLLTKEHIVYGR